MKQYWSSVVWFGVGAVLGQLAESVVFPLWSKLGLLLPISHWLYSHGGDTMDKCWFILWTNVTSWFLVAVVSVIGCLFIKRCLVLNLMLFGFGFAFVPLVICAYLYSQVPSFNNVVQHAISIGLALLCGLLCRRSRRQPIFEWSKPSGSHLNI